MSTLRVWLSAAPAWTSPDFCSVYYQIAVAKWDKPTPSALASRRRSSRLVVDTRLQLAPSFSTGNHIARPNETSRPNFSRLFVISHLVTGGVRGLGFYPNYQPICFLFLFWIEIKLTTNISGTKSESWKVDGRYIYDGGKQNKASEKGGPGNRSILVVPGLMSDALNENRYRRFSMCVCVGGGGLVEAKEGMVVVVGCCRSIHFWFVRHGRPSICRFRFLHQLPHTLVVVFIFLPLLIPLLFVVILVIWERGLVGW